METLFHFSNWFIAFAMQSYQLYITVCWCLSRFIKFAGKWICERILKCANTPPSCMVYSYCAHDYCAAHRVSDWESMDIPDREAGSNRLKIDNRHGRHCRGHYHLEVRLWVWTVIWQRYYLEWPARTTPCASTSQFYWSRSFLFIIAAAPAKHVALFIFVAIWTWNWMF